MRPRAAGQKSDTSSSWTEVSDAQHARVPGLEAEGVRASGGGSDRPWLWALSAAWPGSPGARAGGQAAPGGTLTVRGLGFRRGLRDGALLPGGVRGPGGRHLPHQVRYAAPGCPGPPAWGVAGGSDPGSGRAADGCRPSGGPVGAVLGSEGGALLPEPHGWPPCSPTQGSVDFGPEITSSDKSLKVLLNAEDKVRCGCLPCAPGGSALAWLRAPALGGSRVLGTEGPHRLIACPTAHSRRDTECLPPAQLSPLCC